MALHSSFNTLTAFLLPFLSNAINTLFLSLPFSFPLRNLFLHLVDMRLVRVSSIKAFSFSPKRLFSPKKDRISGSRSDPSYFSYGSSASSSSSSSSDATVHRKGGDSGTPTSVLPGASGDWSDAKLGPLRSFKLDDPGSVPKKQLEALLCRLGNEPPSRDEMALMLREVGCPADDDGAYVSVEALLSRVGCGPTCDAAELKETFDFFDTDHDGRITAEELLQVLTALGDEGCSLEDCQRMIAEVDKNRNGFVCFEDFAQMMELQR